MRDGRNLFRLCEKHRKDMVVQIRYSDFAKVLPLFDGFPYLSIRVLPAFYHIILLPIGLAEHEYANAGQRQILANRLPVCVVLEENRGVYFSPDHGRPTVAEPPLGGLIVSDRLAPAIDGDDSNEEFRTRARRLADFIERVRGDGRYIGGDPTKGGHVATVEDKRRLDGTHPDGTPRGLTRCMTCGDWKGVCLDPSEHFAGQVMTVHCYCDNDNRCARCHQLLYERRLNANYYDPIERRIWHIPGFRGLAHRCADQQCSDQRAG